MFTIHISVNGEDQYIRPNAQFKTFKLHTETKKVSVTGLNSITKCCSEYKLDKRDGNSCHMRWMSTK